MSRLVAGIDIGGTNTKIGIVDEKGRVIAKSNLSTPDYPVASDYVDAVCSAIKKLSSEISGIGIGAPNGNYFKGTIELAPNLKWKGIVPMVKLFSEKMNVPVTITNDAKAAALGEMFFGAAKGIKDFIYITLGTGLGCGIMVDGKLIYGHDGFAGEVGHVTIMPHGRLCGCGRKGCLEQYCSATGLVKTYFEILRNSNPDAFNNVRIDKVDSEYIYNRALAGDEDAFHTFNYTGELLGMALANAVVFTSPSAIFLFGGLANAGELIFNPTILSFEKNIMPIYRGKVKILPSGLPESDCAILGAASLIWNELKK